MDEPVLTRIVLPLNGDATVTLAITDPTKPLVDGQPQPFDLTGKTVTFWRKSTRFVPDTDSSAKSYTASLAADPKTGVCYVAIPGADNGIAGVTWWRADVVSGTSKMPMTYGPLEVFSVLALRYSAEVADWEIELLGLATNPVGGMTGNAIRPSRNWNGVSDTRVRAKRPDTGKWATATLLRNSGREVTVQFGDEDPVVVASKDVRPVARQGSSRGR